jgi:hypothetical protein
MNIVIETSYLKSAVKNEPLVAVPLSLFKKYFPRTLKNLSKTDITASYKTARAEQKSGKLTSARDFLKSL